MTLRYSTDIVIFGGGIAGLWLLNKVTKEGYDAILIESDCLGGGQTLASQGIIHGGLKYAISGKLAGAADAIANMPGRWRDCLSGKADIDLRSCSVLCENYYMWSNSGVRSKLKTFLGSKSLRGRVETIKPDLYPEFFTKATVKGSLYKLPDFVINTESLLENLILPVKDKLYQIGLEQVCFKRDGNSLISSIEIQTAEGPINIDANRFVFAAGKGNEALIEKAKLDKPKTQLRPLNMVYLSGADLPEVYVHCIGDSFSLTPKLTVTSHQGNDGKTVWYLGGELAESGVAKTKAAQIESAKSLIASVFPWVDLRNVEWNSFMIERAEPAVSSLSRPDDAYFIEDSNVIVTWPTKLTLAPSLGDTIASHLASMSIKPGKIKNDFNLATKIPRPTLALAQWNL